MAVKYREKCKSKPWEVYWRNPVSGKRDTVRVATEAEAKKVDAQIKYRLKFERDSFREDAGGKLQTASETPQKITFEKCFRRYLDDRKFTGKSFENVMYSARPALREMGKMVVDDITLPILKKFIAKLEAQGHRASTIVKRVGSFRAVVKWGEENGLCGKIPIPRLRPANYEKFIPPTPRELSTMLEVAEPHIKRVIILGSQLGARIGQSELFSMRWDDVDMDQSLVRLRGAKKNLNAPWREVPIREELLPILLKWRESDMQIGAKHLVHYRGRAVKSIKTSWEKALKKAGIIRRVRPYDLRHAFATELIAGGTDIGTVASLMGHSSPMMLLKHYQYVMDKQKRKAVECLPKLPFV